MKNKIKYTNEYLGKVKVVKDFLPPSEQFAFKEDTVRVTLLLSRFSVDFFRSEAKKQHTKYQKMIQKLLDEYTYQHSL